jgi:spermidine synthase
MLARFRVDGHVLLITLSLFMTGATGMVIEYVLSTMSSYINGSEIESFSLTIAIMMGMMGVGGWAQRFVSDANLIEKFAYLEMTLAVVGAFAPIATYLVFSYAPEHYQLVYYAFAMSIGFMVGFEIPFITRVNETYTKKLSDNLSIVFAADYLGALVGAFVWVYLLLPHMNIAQIGFVLSVLNFAVAMMTYVYFKRGYLFDKKRPLVLMIVVPALLVFGGLNAVDWAKVADQKMYPDPIVMSTKTKYQQLTLTHNPINNDTRLYINGGTQFSSVDEVRYHEALVHIPAAIFQGELRRVLVMGGGDGLAVRELLKYDNLAIDLVELDEQMFDWALTQPRMKQLNGGAFDHFNRITPENYDRLQAVVSRRTGAGEHRVIFTDAANFINAHTHARADLGYDLVILDLPDPHSLAINKMYTKQFYRRLMSVLSDGGVVVTQATSPFHAKDVFLSIGMTLRDAGYNALPYRHSIPSFGEWGWWVASRKGLSLSPLRVETAYLTDRLARASFEFGKGALHSPSAKVNSLLEPHLVRMYQQAWKVE